MALTLTVQSSASATTAFGSVSVGPLSYAGSIAPQLSSVTLASGANTVTVPTGAVGVVITPPATNAIVLKIKGVSGDTGLQIPLTEPFVFCFEPTAPPATFVINAASLTTGLTQFLFF